MNTTRLLTFLVLLAILGGCAARQPGHDIAATFSIPDAGNPNSSELKAFEEMYRGDDEKSLAARFLLENLPPADQLSMSAQDLAENLDYAFLAREAMPWGKTVPWDTFLHYVLPHRTSQEPFQSHRAMLFGELAPLCATAANMEEALVRVAKWCAERAEYRPTSRRDLGVISVLEAGYGRCEETNILFMAAARAVGLPVRQAMVPWWQHADGNHAWVEAWTKDGWKFLESGTEFSALNQTWFAAEAPRMAKVVAHVFGRPQDPAVYRTGTGFALVDNTDAYTRGTPVQVSVRTAEDQPAPGRDVFFSVYSLGGLRPVTRAVTNDNGQARVILGPGTYFVSAPAEDGLAWTLLDTRDMDETRVRLHTETARALPESIRLSHPEQAASSFNAAVSTRLKRLRAERLKRWEPLLRALPDPLSERLALAGQRAPEWLRLLNLPPGPASPLLPALVANLDDKDLLQAEIASLPRDIALALQARQDAEKTGLSYDDAIFERFVLSPRLYLEPWSPWRAELHPRLNKFTGLTLPGKVSSIRQLIDTLPILPPTLFGPPLTPLQTLQGGFCTSATDKIVLATAALRTLGVPARSAADFNAVEYFDGADWQFWEMRPALPAGGTLAITDQKDRKPLKDFGVARIFEGHLRALDDLPWKKTEKGWACAMQPGDYLLLTPARDASGVTVRLRPFTVSDSQTTVIDADSIK
jgi:transglutaminase-like putative cysteine protease